MALKTAASVVGQLPANVDLAVYQGDDIFLNVIVDDSQVPIDLTTYTAKAEIHASPGGALVATFTATIVDSTTVQLHLPHTETAKLVVPTVWDVQIQDSNGLITTLAYGAVATMRQVTP